MLAKLKNFFTKQLTAPTNAVKIEVPKPTKGQTSMDTVLNSIIESGKICKVEFVKKDGSTGVVHGRTGVYKHTKGGKRTSDDGEYIMFYDFEKGYRNVNRRTITRVNGINLRIASK